MNKLSTLALVVFVLIGSYLIFSNPKPVPQSIQENPATSSTSQRWESKTSDQGDVTMTITPTDLSPGAKAWTFEVDMNTHSVELASPMASVVLVDDQSREYKSIAWDGPTEGHHMNGTLTFAPIPSMQKSLTLQISVAGEPAKNFTWQL